MSTWHKKVCALALAMGVAIGLHAEELVITSFDRSGQLTFSEVSSATEYRVEWASTPNGPWTNSWNELAAIPAAGTGSVTCAVPMCYRVVAAVTPSNPPPEGMVLIPTGSFSMGDSYGEGISNERPVHTVDVSAFYVDRYEVTKALWDEVYGWAVANGYSFDFPGSGKGANHPVCAVTWYECVKWCNARSEREGVTPAYYTSAAKTTVYRTGHVTVQNDWVRWDTGYRLPTEAEWEKAARGGLSGKRFPWGDTINHSKANYMANGSLYGYDTSPYTSDTYHPDYDEGEWPYTSPVGSFAANGYGLADMAGNVWEWCWDWYSGSYYEYVPGSDPRGPLSGSYRVLRGGSWLRNAAYCRVASRNTYDSPDLRNGSYGFRAVLSPGQ